MKHNVSNIMTKVLYIINAEDGVRKAARIMDEKGIGCLPVYDDGRLIGIITSKDILRTHPNRIVADAMSYGIIPVKPETSLWEAHRILNENNIQRLLVLDEENLVGILTKAALLSELGKHVDLLTSLYKSEYIINHISELIMNGVEVSIIFIDLDKFGLIDKEYGHVVGDIILKEVSELLMEHVPEETYICRYGGDEFVVLTPYNIDKCKLLAENLLNIISTHVFYNELNINASAGITSGTFIESAQNNPLNVAKTLINLASLASTKAKSENCRIFITEDICISEIA